MYTNLMLDFIGSRRGRGGNILVRLRGINRLQLVYYVVLASFISLIFGIILFGLLFVWYARDLPHPDRIKRVDGLSTIIYDRNGEVLYDIYRDENRVPLSIDEIPQNIKNEIGRAHV